MKTLLRAAFLAVVLAGLCVVTAAAAHVGVATVEPSNGLRLREEIGTDTKILATASKGDKVIVLELAENGWYKVDYNLTIGYMSSEYLELELECEAKLGYGIVEVNGGSLNIRERAGTSALLVGKIPDGTLIELEGMSHGWYKVTYNGKEGYVSSDYVTRTDKRPGQNQGRSTQRAENIPDEKVPTVDLPTGYDSSELGAQIAAYAKKFVGYPYVYGASGPRSFDCSGLVYYVAKQFGYTVPRTASAQWTSGPGKRIYSMSEMEPGDLFFMNNPIYGGRGKPVSHVGIYIGGGKVLHASSPSTGVIISDLSASWLGPYFVGAIRLG